VRKTSYTHNGSAWVESTDLLFVYDDWNVVLVLDANDDNEVTHKHTWASTSAACQATRASAASTAPAASVDCWPSRT
jgi:hypothetical protein